MSNHTFVMRGNLREFALTDVLQVVGISRQLTCVELRGQGSELVGAIWMKAGRVINAQFKGNQGRDAFMAILRTGAEGFVVSRLADRTSYPSLLGKLEALLTEAGEQTAVDPPVNGAAAVAAAPAPVAVTAPLPRAHGSGLLPTKTTPARAPTSQPRAVTTHPVPPPPIRPGLSDDAERAKKAAARRSIVVAVASPKGGVGKTTITLNLALSLAERGFRCIAVDADVNGDLLSLLDARGKAQVGVLDVLERQELLGSALRETAVPNLRILPGTGAVIPQWVLDRKSCGDSWRRVIDSLRADCDAVLIDCPAGMFDLTRDILAASTHVVGVCQAEIIGGRGFDMFQRALATVPADRRPELLGVVINMFQGRVAASVETFHNLCHEADLYRLFETTIPRTDAFADAALAGQPLRLAADGDNPVAWLFDSLAAEVCERTGLKVTANRTPKPFLI